MGNASTALAQGTSTLTCRPAAESPDGGLIADYHGPIGPPRELAARLSQTPGVVGHGLFPPELVSLIVLAGEGGIERRRGKKPFDQEAGGAGLSSSS